MRAGGCPLAWVRARADAARGGAGLDASPGPGEGCCGACVARGRGLRSLVPARVGRGPEGACGSPTSPARGPRPGAVSLPPLPPVACFAVTRGPPPPCETLGSARKEEIVAGDRLQGEDGQAAPGLLCMGVGVHLAPLHLEVTSWAPRLEPPPGAAPPAGGESTCRLRVDLGRRGAPSPTQPSCPWARSQFRWGRRAGAAQNRHTATCTPSSQQASPRLCSWVVPALG